MTAIAYPFLRPEPDSVVASDWLVLEDGEPLVIASGFLPHFDYSSRLHANRRLQADMVAIAAAIQLDADHLELECLTFLGTGGGRLARSTLLMDRQTLRHDAQAISIEFDIPGEALSQSIDLTTEIVVRSPGNSVRTLSPRGGSRLWRDSYRLSLESATPRFPMEVVSFQRVFPDEPCGALWYLDWSPGDLDQEFSTAARLYINGDAPEFVDRVHEADEHVLRLLMTGIATQMTRAAIFLADTSVLKRDFSRSSLGGAISDWIARSFPGRSLEAIRTLAEYDPARFEMAIGSLGGASDG